MHVILQLHYYVISHVFVAWPIIQHCHTPSTRVILFKNGFWFKERCHETW